MSDHPPQVKWLGAVVEGYGRVIAVTTHERGGFAVLGGLYNFREVPLIRLRRLTVRLPKTQPAYSESFENRYGTELYVLTGTLEEIKMQPPKHRRGLFRERRVHR